MTMNKLSNTQQRNQRGFSLIEVLISVLVFGVGILGLGGLQIASLKGSNNAHYRTTATVLAMDLADRMRSNLNGVSAGHYGEALDCSTTSASSTLCRSSACSIAQLALFDLQEVMCGSRRGTSREGGVEGLLPSGSMTVTCATGCITALGDARATHNIEINWNSQKTNGQSTGDDQSRSLTMPVIP